MNHYEVVCAIIENLEGKIFCCKRGSGKALEGYWEFPGGKVEAHETHEETIIREIEEELGSEIEPYEYLGKTTHTYPDMPPYPGFDITMYAYRCRLKAGHLDLSEHTDKRWASKEEMKGMKFADADKPIIEML